jgi:nitrate/nitrite transporter NarK
MSRYRWVILGVCLLGFMQVHIHRVGFAPLIPTFMGDLGITYAAAATIMTAYFWTYALVQVPVGVLADRLGPRRMMLTFLGILVVGVIAFPLSRDYTQSLVTRGLIGLGAAGIWLPGLRLIYEWFPPQERGRATGLFSAGGGIGGTAALMLVPVLAEHFGWRWGYAMTLLPLFTTLALIFLLVRPGPLAERRSPAAASRGTTAVLKDVLSLAVLWPINVAVFFSYGAFIALVTFLPAFLVRQEGLTPGRAGFVTGLITAGTVVSWPLAGFISDWMGRRKVIYLFSQGMCVLSCLAFALLVPGTGRAGAALVALVTGLMLGGLVTPFVMVVELFPSDLIGTASGVVNTFCFAGSLLIPVLVGKILDVSGSFPAAFMVCAAFEAVALASAAFTRETGMHRRPVMVT